MMSWDDVKLWNNNNNEKQATLPLLGFSVMVFDIFTRPWDMGFFHENLGFFLGFLKSPWVFWVLFSNLAVKSFPDVSGEK